MPSNSSSASKPEWVLHLGKKKPRLPVLAGNNLLESNSAERDLEVGQQTVNATAMCPCSQGGQWNPRVH